MQPFTAASRRCVSGRTSTICRMTLCTAGGITEMGVCRIKEADIMTLEEIKTSDKPMLIPKDIAPILGCDPYTISIKARDCPEQLGFPICRMGSRTRIPRKAFLKWLGEDNT